jgi:hypothetical protein
LSRFSVVAACFAVVACKGSAPSRQRFCDQDLSGVWLNSSDKRFAYSFRDDGGVVEGDFMERAEDGGLTKPAERITFELKRSAGSVEGVMRSTGTTPGGKTCPVEFATRINDCKPDALQAVVEVSAPVGEDCKRLTPEDGGAYPPDLREFRFERERR